MLITSLDNDYIVEISKLNMRKYRELNHMFLVEGIHLVQEAYDKGYLIELIKLDGEPYTLDIKTTEVTLNVMKKISNLDLPSNIVGVCKMKENTNIIGNKVLILDRIQDPGNLGTIIRSCVAFNIDTIVIGDNSVDLYNSKTIRASQGMIFNINIIETNIIDFINKIHSDGYKVIGTNVEDGIELKNIEKQEKYAIIMGNEGNGIDKEIEGLCDYNIYIKMNSNCESLNVGVATSIILYELNK